MHETDSKYSSLLICLAENIKAARLRNRLRQSDMIDFGFSERFIQKLESGNYSPNLYTMHRIACALKTPIDELFKKPLHLNDDIN
ncbi:helix-turn-helix transcriptional regulator [Bacteriovorax sp. PP10]|uniref:Helix-turn-helix transcriptional regulator n=1 Tax=Bacteriovorax antarcticus TaxID=3088717 RepID=A0ABU5W0Q6_9BACT|nr:helix-turn-helix transcriptional regulator [Bacteriovorax sp. PP10]MEA9358397.1 helix-turn-helix transcriptional regulator [Bacteriovorax sp. PP10]